MDVSFPAADGTMAMTESGTFTGTLTGCTTSPTVTFTYVKTGKAVTISSDGQYTATQNSTVHKITGLPSSLYPVHQTLVFFYCSDNGATSSLGYSWITTGGVINVRANMAAANWSGTGSLNITFPAFTYITAA